MKKILFRLTTILLAVAFAASLSACGSPAATTDTPSAAVTGSGEPSAPPSPETAPSSTGGNVITDSANQQVVIPAAVNRVADAWRAHNDVVIMLGAGDKIVATVITKSGAPWMYKIQPSLTDALSTFGTDFNTEDLVAQKPDVIFVSSGDTSVPKLQSLGIPVVQLAFTTFDQMKDCITLTAQVLGGGAPERAVQYNAYLDDTISSVTAVTSQIPDAQKLKVLHVESLDPLEVDGGNTIIDQWITDAGGVDVAAQGGVSGNMQQVTMEQVIAWNPDVIIIGANGVNGKVSTVQELMGDQQWASIAAVQNNRVYQNPTGVYLWDRYSPEEVLQLQWAAKTLYSDQFASVDMSRVVTDFYKTYYNYDLTSDDVNAILTAQAQPPA